MRPGFSPGRAPASTPSPSFHQWLSTEGVFGIALGVSTDLVFLFVLFGALLDKAGAGNYFIKVAFSLMGHFSGGPAKAAVVASGMTGLISGSSIANVVTTGTFTIPMMRRVGFSPEKAGAVEVASSVNGQIMPPVMGAAAFLMVEYIGISYFEVVKHAFIPAIISYIALVYIVHLEAMRKGMEGLPRASEPKPLKWALISFGVTISVMLAIAGGIYYLFAAFEALGSSQNRLFAVLIVLGLIACVMALLRSRAGEDTRMRVLSTGALVIGVSAIASFGLFFFMDVLTRVTGNWTQWAVAVLLLAVYVGLVRYCSQFPDLEMDDPNVPVVRLPEPGPTVKSGLHFLLPVFVLIWCLMVERLSPSLSAFWAAMLMIFILLTQRPLFAYFRNEPTEGTVSRGWSELIDGMIAGARNMIGIGIATAAAGIIVGAVSQTGVGAVLAALVEFLSQGQILLILIFTAILSLILGMGLPTTANYIVVSSLLAPVIVALGAAERTDRAARGGTSVRVLLRHHGGRDAAGGACLICRGGGLGRRSDPHRFRGVLLFAAHRAAAVPVHLQHRHPADRRDAAGGRRGLHRRDGGHPRLHGRGAGLLHRALAAVGIGSADPGGVHAVPSRLLDGSCRRAL